MRKCFTLIIFCILFQNSINAANQDTTERKNLKLIFKTDFLLPAAALLIDKNWNFSLSIEKFFGKRHCIGITGIYFMGRNDGSDFSFLEMSPVSTVSYSVIDEKQIILDYKYFLNKKEKTIKTYVGYYIKGISVNYSIKQNYSYNSRSFEQSGIAFGGQFGHFSYITNHIIIGSTIGLGYFMKIKKEENIGQFSWPDEMWRDKGGGIDARLSLNIGYMF